MKINFCFQITLHALLGEDVFKFNCRFSFPQRLGGVQDSDHSIYEMIQKKDEKQTNKKQKKKNKLCDFFFFPYFVLPWLFTALQVEIHWGKD